MNARVKSGRVATHAKPNKLAPGADTLVAAVSAVLAVVQEGRSADDALAFAEARADRAAVRAITLGTLRWYFRLVPVLRTLVERDVESTAPLLRALLVTAAHQVEYSRGAPEVSVHLAVEAARGLGLERATGFVNAVLRRFVRERDAAFASVDADPAVRTAHPAWFAAAVTEAWPEQAISLLEANDGHPPMVLRVARRGDESLAITTQNYLQELAAEGRAAVALGWCAGAVRLEHSAPVSALPGFRDGRVSVQDAGAQLAARLLAPLPGDRVLDACAAPGGKTGHILECEPGVGSLLAIDSDESRLSLVRGTLERLAESNATMAEACRRVNLRAADLTVAETLADEDAFDRILLDAPCSATGVIRRHPDIKLLRRPEDIQAFARLQGLLLDRCFAKLAPAGRLVYATCSVLPQENEAVVQAFLDRTPAARSSGWPEGVELPPGSVQGACGVQLLPGAGAGTDGFYYACLGRGESE